MFTIFAVLIFITCILLILIVLVQNSKGGGLASNFSAANQVMGVRKSTDFLEKATWTLAIALVVLSLMGSIAIGKKDSGPQSKIQEQVNSAITPTSIPQLPSANQNTQKTETKKTDKK